jgi:hypothetical protein
MCIPWHQTLPRTLWREICVKGAKRSPTVDPLVANVVIVAENVVIVFAVDVVVAVIVFECCCCCCLWCLWWCRYSLWMLVLLFMNAAVVAVYECCCRYCLWMLFVSVTVYECYYHCYRMLVLLLFFFFFLYMNAVSTTGRFFRTFKLPSSDDKLVHCFSTVWR